MACRSSQPLTKKKSKTIEMISLIVNKPAVCIDMRIVVMMSLNGDWGQQHDSQDQLQKIYDDLIRIYCKIANSTLLSLGRYRSTWNLFISTHKNIQLVARVIASHLSINFQCCEESLSWNYDDISMMTMIALWRSSISLYRHERSRRLISFSLVVFRRQWTRFQHQNNDDDRWIIFPCFPKSRALEHWATDNWDIRSSRSSCNNSPYQTHFIRHKNWN